MAIVKIKGIPFDFGGEVLVIPPIALGALETMQDELQSFSGDLSRKSVSTVIDATHAALRRNYPEITRERVADLLDAGNMMEVMQAIMDVSGLHRQQLEDAGKLLPQPTE